MDYGKLAIIFSDDLITSTFLNQQAEKVLDMASVHPVTITRQEEAFALLRREEVAKLIETTEELKTVVEVLNVAYRLLTRVEIGSEHPYGWINVFDSDELGELIEEILDAFRHSVDLGDWNILKSVIHEWHESAIALRSADLAAVFSDEYNEMLLTPPSSVEV